MESQVVGGYEKDGNIFVEVVLAESGYLNKNDVGYTAEFLQRMHDQKMWDGILQNVHPSKNHPLVYEPPAPSTLGESGKIAYYTGKCNKYGYGTYIKTKLKTLSNGVTKQLRGIFRIVDEGAKKAWREGKFPRYNSSSVYIKSKTPDGLISDGFPVGSSSVEAPAYPVDVARIQNECHGGEECVTSLAESGVFCRHEVLTGFENNFSSQYNQEVSESSMVDDKPKPDSTEEKPKESLQTISETQTSADGSTTKEITSKKEEESIDWEAKFKAAEKENKKLLKLQEEKDSETNKKFEKIFREKLETNIRGKLEKVPLFAFDNKEENRESALEGFMKFYPKLGEDEIMSMVDNTYKLAPKIVEVSKHKKVGESGMISNEGKLIVEKSDNVNPKAILRAHLFGGQ